MDTWVGQPPSLRHGAVGKLAGYRPRMPLKMLGWQPYCQDGIELDQIDASDTLHLTTGAMQQGKIDVAAFKLSDRMYQLRKVRRQRVQASELPHASTTRDKSDFARAADGASGLRSHRPRRERLPEQALRVIAGLRRKNAVHFPPLVWEDRYCEGLLQLTQIPAHGQWSFAVQRGKSELGDQ